MLIITVIISAHKTEKAALSRISVLMLRYEQFVSISAYDCNLQSACVMAAAGCRESVLSFPFSSWVTWRFWTDPDISLLTTLCSSS